MSEVYEGVVCYVGHDHESEDGRQLQGGWHYTVVESPSGGDMPGERLVLADDGSYHLAGDGDVSHHDLHHQMFKTFVVGSEDEQISVTPEQWEQIQQIMGRSQ